MSNHSPYNNELAKQMENVPLPNIDMAWADMKKRLQKDDDDKPLLPFWLNGCAIWAFLGVLLLGTGFWYFNRVTKEKKIAKNELTDTSSSVKKNNNTVIITKVDTVETITKTKTIDSNTISISKPKEIFIPTKNKNSDVKNFDKIIYAKKEKGKKRISTTESTFTTDNESLNAKKTKGKTKVKITSGTTTEDFENKISTTKKVRGKKKVKTSAPSLAEGKEDETIVVENINTSNKKIEAKKDSPTTTKKDSMANTKAVKKDTTPIIQPLTDTAKKNVADEKLNKKLFFTGGIGMQQQLPFNGEKLTPYNSLGRKGSLLDYIPALYIRVEKEKKWFVQIEGKYGAPQYNKEFAYIQKSVPDTGFQPPFTTKTSAVLKKSYYHQVPLSFNYYITPKWSIGTGIQWNKFAGALTETEIIRKNNFTQRDSVVSNVLDINKKDTNNLFAKSYFLGLIETQYKWKRFAFGAKYTFGLSPYITFTLPGGTQQKITSNTATVFVKYELWRSKKKK